MAEPTITLPLT